MFVYEYMNVGSMHPENIHSALLFPHCCVKWIKFIILLKILQTIPHEDNVKEVCLKSLQIC